MIQRLNEWVKYVTNKSKWKLLFDFKQAICKCAQVAALELSSPFVLAPGPDLVPGIISPFGGSGLWNNDLAAGFSERT